MSELCGHSGGNINIETNLTIFNLSKLIIREVLGRKMSNIFGTRIRTISKRVI